MASSKNLKEDGHSTAPEFTGGAEENRNSTNRRQRELKSEEEKKQKRFKNIVIV